MSLDCSVEGLNKYAVKSLCSLNAVVGNSRIEGRQHFLKRLFRSVERCDTLRSSHGSSC